MEIHRAAWPTGSINAIIQGTMAATYPAAISRRAEIPLDICIPALILNLDGAFHRVFANNRPADFLAE